MTRWLTVIALTVVMLVPAIALSGHSSAVDIFKHTCDAGQPAATTSVCGSVGGASQSQNPIVKIIKGAIEVISLLVGIAAIIGILVSGLRLILANGDSNAVASARTGLIYSLVGVAVTLSAQAIVVFVLDKV